MTAGDIIAFVPEALFDALGAAEAPLEAGDVADQGFLEDAHRLELADEVGAELVELVGVFGIEDEVCGVGAVGDGVKGGAELAFLGDGAGGALGIPAIGFDLRER